MAGELQIPNVPDNVLEKLPSDWTVERILEEGVDGLKDLDGIGPTYARRILEGAQRLSASESGETKPESPEPDDDPAPDPEPAAKPLPKFVDVKLVGAETAVVGIRSMWRGDTRRVRYQDYRRAAENHPGAFLVRRHAGEKWGTELK